jgi:hypothetical protein
VDSALVGVQHHPLRDLVGAGREQHAQHHVVGGPVGVIDEQLLDHAGEPVHELVREAQVHGVVHLVGRRAVRAPRLLRELAQNQGEEPRLVERLQVREEVDFGLKIHGVRPGRSRSVWWS